MAIQIITIRVAGAPALQTKGKVETVRDLGRLFAKAHANIRGTDRFLRGYSAAKVQSVSVAKEK